VGHYRLRNRRGDFVTMSHDPSVETYSRGRELQKAEQKLKVVEKISRYREEKIKREFIKLEEELKREEQRLKQDREKERQKKRYMEQ
jgi:hypothetical protein